MYVECWFISGTHHSRWFRYLVCVLLTLKNRIETQSVHSRWSEPSCYNVWCRGGTIQACSFSTFHQEFTSHHDAAIIEAHLWQVYFSTWLVTRYQWTARTNLWVNNSDTRNCPLPGMCTPIVPFSCNIMWSLNNTIWRCLSMVCSSQELYTWYLKHSSSVCQHASLCHYNLTILHPWQEWATDSKHCRYIRQHATDIMHPPTNNHKHMSVSKTTFMSEKVSMWVGVNVENV